MNQYTKMFITALFAFSSVTTAIAATELRKLTETSLKTSNSWMPASKEGVLYLDNAQKLFIVDNDGSNRRDLSQVGDTALPVIGHQPGDFLFVKTDSNQRVVYFQARESATSFKANLYKVNLGQDVGPVKLFPITKPFKSLESSPDGKFIFLRGDNRHSLLRTSNDITTTLDINSVAAAPLSLSPDMKQLVFVEESQVNYETRYFLKSLNLETSKITTLLGNQKNFEFSVTFAADSLSLAISYKKDGSSPTLLWSSVDGTAQTQIFPLAGDSAVSLGYQKFIAGVRGEGDPGSLIFEGVGSNGEAAIYLASLLDLTPIALGTQLVYGEKPTNIQLTADSKRLVFKRAYGNQFEGGSGVTPRTFAIDLLDISKPATFLFESTYEHSVVLRDSEHMVFLSQGGFYEVNQLVRISLDGSEAKIISAQFKKDWLDPQETISKIAVNKANTFYFVKTTVGSSAPTHHLMSFEQ